MKLYTIWTYFLTYTYTVTISTSWYIRLPIPFSSRGFETLLPFKFWMSEFLPDNWRDHHGYRLIYSAHRSDSLSLRSSSGQDPQLYFGSLRQMTVGDVASSVSAHQQDKQLCHGRNSASCLDTSKLALSWPQYFFFFFYFRCWAVPWN
jgi:hypothetical protein